MEEKSIPSGNLPDTDLLVSVIAEISTTAMENGAEVYRAEEMCERIATTMGASNINVLAIPTALCISLEMPDGQRRSTICRVKSRSIRLDVLDQANSISRRIVEGSLSLDEARSELESLRKTPSASLLTTMLWAGGAAGSLAMLYGGGWAEFFCAVIAGSLSQFAMHLIGQIDSSQLIKTLAGSFVAAVIACLLHSCIPGSDKSMTIIGAIMPMLPGLAVTNAIRDMMHGDLLSGNARLFEGLLTACAVAAGVVLALSLV